MKKVIFSLIAILFSASSILCQKHQYAGKTLVNSKLDQIEFINDTIIDASFLAFDQKIEFQHDSVRLTKGGTLFKVLQKSPDTLTFIYNSYGSIDTMQFINIQNRVIALRDFDSIRVDSYGWAGFGRIIIRNDKTIKFAEGDWILPDEKPRYRLFKLTYLQYQNLIDTLSKSLIFMLPKYRGECGEDVTDTDFYIHTNGITITSKGSCLSKIHYKLISYLFYYIARGN